MPDPSPTVSRPEVPVAPLRLSFATVLGTLLLVWSSSVYTAFGFSAFPRQEWLVEALSGGIFILPVLNLLKGPGRLDLAVRLLGVALIVHSGWDALHWPGAALIQTPVDSWLPRICPLLDLPVGAWLLIKRAAS